MLMYLCGKKFLNHLGMKFLVAYHSSIILFVHSWQKNSVQKRNRMKHPVFITHYLLLIAH